MFAQHHVGKGVKGAAGDQRTSLIQHAAGTMHHLLSRFASESEQQNRPRIDPLLDQIGNPVDQGARLAGARSGNDQMRPI